MSIQLGKGRILEKRVDWITCTAKMGQRAAGLLTFAALQCRHEHDLGDKMEPWRFQGYRGFQSGEWRYGNGQYGAIAIASSEQAELSKEMLAKLADHWSRIDYCVTVLHDDVNEDPAEVYWNAFKTGEVYTPHSTTVTRIQSTAGGATLAIGSRASATFLRVYDKHAESKGRYPKGTWRYEVEYKREHSEKEHAYTRDGHRNPADGWDIPAWELRAHQLPIPWEAGQRVEKVAGLSRVRDADRCLRWLSDQVAPTVAFCAEARGRDAVLEALNISSHVLMEREV